MPEGFNKHQLQFGMCRVNDSCTLTNARAVKSMHGVAGADINHVPGTSLYAQRERKPQTDRNV